MSRRFFVPSLDTQSELVALPPDEARHAATVLRLKAGDSTELFDGSGRLGKGVFTEVSKRTTTVEIQAIETPDSTARSARIATAVPKGKRWQSLIEKCTELGVAEIQPIRFDRSVAEGGDSERWARWTLEAAKQCNRLTLPLIHPPQPFTAWIGMATPNWYLADAAGITPQPGGSVNGILIGPEGGLTEEELGRCTEAGLGRMRLGPHILRTETAAITACAIQQWSVS